MSSKPSKPNEAIGALYKLLKKQGLFITPAFVAQDLANVRRAYPNDVDFANAIHAVVNEIARAYLKPESHGTALDHDLAGWRRSKFAPQGSDEATLRLIFQPANPGVRILAFGDRSVPDSAYFTANERVK